MLSFSPHCSHKLQPLDRSVYFPLKKFFNTQCDAWCSSHPGRTMQILDIPSLCAVAFPLAMTPVNIQSGFRVSGIYPLKRNIFTDDEFMPSLATDRPDPNPVAADEVLVFEPSIDPPGLVISEATSSLMEPGEILVSDSAGPVIQPPTPSCSGSSKSVTPSSVHSIRPLPKAGPRQTMKKGRKRGRTRVLTDTPEKEQLELEEAERLSKKKKPQNKIDKIKASQPLKQPVEGGPRRRVARYLDSQLKATAPSQEVIDGRTRNKKKPEAKPISDSVRKKKNQQSKPPRPAVERPVLPRKPTWMSDRQRPAGGSLDCELNKEYYIRRPNFIPFND